MLTSIELSGFKSFAKKTKLTFTHPISAIVGPNGSGKSNCAEAFRFVLGEQSMKSMRGKRNEDLIFNGTPLVPRANRAGVSLVFNNKKRMFDIDFDEVIFERVVHRDGTNVYSVNGSPVRLKDVTELLAKANIGSSGHHIISQGEADRILAVSGKERKMMIEDALGLKIFHYKRRESIRKLEKTESNIHEVELLRREIKPHLKFLKRQVGQIEEARELSKNLIDGSRYYFAVERAYLSAEEGALAQEKKSPEEEKARQAVLLKEAEEVLRNARSGDPYVEKVRMLAAQVSGYESDKDTLIRQLSRIEGEISAEERLRSRYVQHHNETPHVHVLRSDIDTLEKEAGHAFEHSKSLYDISALRDVLGSVHSTVSDFAVRYRGTSPKVEAPVPDEESIHELTLKRDILMREQEDLGKLLQNALLELENTKNEQRVHRDTYHESEKAVLEIRARVGELNSALSRIEMRERVLMRDKEQYDTDHKEVGHMLGAYVINNGDITVEPHHIYDREHQRTHRALLERQKIQYESLGVHSQSDILREYESLVERDEFLEKEINDLKEAQASLTVLISDLEKELELRFKEGIQGINNQFKEFFGLLFGGGNASLVVTHEFHAEIGDSPEGELKGEKVQGLEVSINLPRKRIKSLEMLSGGERALTSIALLFAISQIHPPAFIILDETDAALDEANSRKYGDMVENLARKSQLVVITHNRETMSRAGHLYGVTMGSDGVSKILSVEFETAVSVAK